MTSLPTELAGRGWFSIRARSAPRHPQLHTTTKAPPAGTGRALSRRDLAPTGSVTYNERSVVVDSSEATPFPRELPAPYGRDTPVSAEFTRIPGRAVSAVRIRLSDRNSPCSAQRAGLYDFLTGPASPDAGDFRMPGIRKEVGKRGLPA